MDDGKVKLRFDHFFKTSLNEIDQINENTEHVLPVPSKVIFGHTHQPISWRDKNLRTREVDNNGNMHKVDIHNTGGWLLADNKFCGAEVFIYEAGEGFKSIRIH